MSEYTPLKPLRVGLFFYEVFRVLLLAGLFVFFSPLEGAAFPWGGVFPFLVYVTPNALFPLMALFLWVRPGAFGAYAPLYLAGKVIAVIAFYAWGVFVFVPVLGLPFLGLEPGNVRAGLVLLGGSFIVSLGDVVSILAGWLLHTKSAKSAKSENSKKGGR
jgi:hypothetical protein